MRAFYSDTFVLPLPEQHRFPMAKYRLLRERLVEEGILSADDLHVPDPVAWEDLRLVHDAGLRGRGRGGDTAGRCPASDRVPVVSDDGRTIATVGWRDARGGA